MGKCSHYEGHDHCNACPTLNERLLARMKQEMGDDPTVTMVLTMFEGNLLSIPEVELKEHIQRYCSVLTDLLLDKP